MIELTETNGDVIISVKAVPNASRNKIAGELDGALKINIAAAPERGAANKAICKLLAKTLGIRTQQVTVETGLTSPRKTVRITNVSADDIRKMIE